MPTTPPLPIPTPAPSRWRWPARLDTLRIKLFLTIAGAHALLALAAFLFFSWSFDQGFVDYLNRADEARLSPLVARLAEGYRRDGHWQWISEDRKRWYDLVREVMGGPRPLRRGEDSPPAPVSAPGPASTPAGPPPAGPAGEQLLTIDPRLLLFDDAQRLLAGRPEMAQDAVLRPVQVDGRVVGYLGYVPRLKTVASLEKLFSAQQNRKFAAIAVGMLLAGLVISAFLSHWLARRIRRLAQGTHALIQGRYGVRIESQGHDELARLAQDFNQLAHTLESAQKARQQWIADIAHELRTPLAVLRAEIEALQDGIRPLGPDGLGSLAQEVAQLSRLVEDLRLLSLSDLGALSYHKEPLDLGELIEDCLASQAGALRAKGFEVRTELPAPVSVLADGARLAQVFGNLLQNTLRYTDAPARLSVSLQSSGGRAQVLWQDSSPGVSTTDLPRLTERLFRVDGSRSRSGGGSGLGLAIAQAIVKAHGGDMAASASPLGGVAWHLALPLAEASSAP